VKVAHIYIMANKTGDQGAYDLAKKRIEEAYAKIQGGEDFASAVKTYSEDFNSSPRGGEIAPFGINQMVQEFEDAAFNLQNPGDVSKPFETNIGFHIVKLIEKVNVPSYDEYKGELSKVVAKNKRWQTVKDAFTAKLKKEYSVEENPAFMTALENEAAKHGGKLTKEQLAEVPVMWMLKIKGAEISSGEFIGLVGQKLTNGATIDVCTLKKTHYNPYVAQKLIDFKEANLSQEYPEFKMLVNEYRDGILLFNLMDQKVWTRSVKDTTGLQQYYEQNKTKYMWGERVHAYIIDCKSDTAEQLARKYADKLASGKMSKEKFLATVNKKVKDNVFITEGVYSQNDNALVDAIGWKQGVSATEKKDGKIKFAVIDRMVAPQPKLLKEAKGIVISDYQNYLEAEWITELQGKYPVQVNKEVLYTLIGK
jgi:peptidyl-prolyl cis-trans isomerase SurA